MLPLPLHPLPYIHATLTPPEKDFVGSVAVLLDEVVRVDGPRPLQVAHRLRVVEHRHIAFHLLAAHLLRGTGKDGGGGGVEGGHGGSANIVLVLIVGWAVSVGSSAAGCRNGCGYLEESAA